MGYHIQRSQLCCDWWDWGGMAGLGKWLLQAEIQIVKSGSLLWQKLTNAPPKSTLKHKHVSACCSLRQKDISPEKPSAPKAKDHHGEEDIWGQRGWAQGRGWDGWKCRARSRGRCWGLEGRWRQSSCKTQSTEIKSEPKPDWKTWQARGDLGEMQGDVVLASCAYVYMWRCLEILQLSSWETQSTKKWEAGSDCQNEDDKLNQTSKMISRIRLPKMRNKIRLQKKMQEETWQKGKMGFARWASLELQLWRCVVARWAWLELQLWSCVGIGESARCRWMCTRRNMTISLSLSSHTLSHISPSLSLHLSLVLNPWQ